MNRNRWLTQASIYLGLAALIWIFSFVLLVEKYGDRSAAGILALFFAFLITISLVFAHRLIIPRLSFLNYSSQVVFKAFVYGASFVIGYVPVWVGEILWRSSQHSKSDFLRFTLDIINKLIEVPFTSTPMSSVLPPEVTNAFASLFGILFLAIALSSIAAFADTQWRKEKMRLADQENQIRFLRAQMQPHFLFNTLNTISTLIPQNPRKAETLLLTLSDFFRKSMEFSRQPLLTISEEMTFIEEYVALLNARFDNGIKLVSAFTPGSEEMQIPTMIIQPMVENAIVHGWKNRDTTLKIEISIIIIENNALLDIADNGTGFDSDKLGHKIFKDGHALDIVRNRLSLVYGKDDLLQIHSQVGHGTSIRITIPQDEK